MINIIAIIDRNRAIGYRNKLLFNIPADMQRFKTLTMGHAVIMGRTTFQSLPCGALPGRRNVVVSRTITSLTGAEVYNSIDKALEACRDEAEVFIIGGGEIFRQTIGIAHRMYLTIVDEVSPHADTWFPPFDTWELKEETHEDGVSFCTFSAPR